jgi:hypothetical protein
MMDKMPLDGAGFEIHVVCAVLDAANYGIWMAISVVGWRWLNARR